MANVRSVVRVVLVTATLLVVLAAVTLGITAALLAKDIALYERRATARVHDTISTTWKNDRQNLPLVPGVSVLPLTSTTQILCAWREAVSRATTSVDICMYALFATTDPDTKNLREEHIWWLGQGLERALRARPRSSREPLRVRFLADTFALRPEQQTTLQHVQKILSLWLRHFDISPHLLHVRCRCFSHLLANNNHIKMVVVDQGAYIVVSSNNIQAYSSPSLEGSWVDTGAFLPEPPDQVRRRAQHLFDDIWCASLPSERDLVATTPASDTFARTVARPSEFPPWEHSSSTVPGAVSDCHAQLFACTASSPTSFWPSSAPQQGTKQLTAAVLVLLRSARTSICVSTPSIGCPLLICALQDAHDRGVSVRVLVGKNHNRLAGIERLAGAVYIAPGGSSALQETTIPHRHYTWRGRCVMHEDRRGTIHAKMLLVDGEWGVVGSYNFTRWSSLHSNELSVVFRSDDLCKRYQEGWFDSLWESAENTRKSEVL